MKRTLKILGGILVAGVLGFVIWSIKYGDKDSSRHRRREPMIVYSEKPSPATNAEQGKK